MRKQARFKYGLLATLVCLLWPVSALAGELVVSQAYARATPPGVSSAAAYLILDNNASENVVLMEVSSNRAKQVMIHQNQLQGDMMRMRHVAQLDVAAHGQLRFEPGGYHLMLTGLTQPLKAGEQLQLNLRFLQGQALEVNLPVLAVGADFEKKGHHE